MQTSARQRGSDERSAYSNQAFSTGGWARRWSASAPKGVPQSNTDGDSNDPNDSPDGSGPGEQDDSGTGDEDTATPASGQALPSFDPDGTGEVMDAAARRDDDIEAVACTRPAWSATATRRPSRTTR